LEGGSLVAGFVGVCTILIHSKINSQFPVVSANISGYMALVVSIPRR